MLFRNQSDHTTREEVIILLTPHIVKDEAAYAEASASELKEMEKLRVGSRVVVEVSDTGPGIPESIRERLFEPFVSSKESGTGLGLTISRRIVEQHGGTIEAANRHQGGALFSVHLPA